MPLHRLRRTLFLAALGGVALASATASAIAQADPAVERHPETVLRRIAFGSCAKEDRAQPIWSNVLASEPDLWIWAGDNVYGDTEDVAELRAKYALLAAIPGYAALRASVPILATWDDHDYGRNDAGVEFPRKRESQQAFLDFFGVPADSPRRTREGVYHAATFGPEGRRVQVILLDTRYHRSPLEEFETGTRRQDYRPTRERAATVLGAEQWRWLEARLREPADLRLIVSSIQFVAEEQRFEKWANHPLERERMLRLLKDTEAQGVLFLSGDRHHAELSRLPRDGDYPLFELTASGINQSFGPRPGRPYRIPEDNAWRVGEVFKGPHFGTVEIDWEQPDPVVSLRIVSTDSAPFGHDLRLGDLSSAAGMPYAMAIDSVRDRESHVVDGDPDEWRGGSLLALDGRFLHGRFDLGTVRSLAAGGEAVRIALDLDGDDTTGDAVDGLAGVDLTIEYDPMPDGDRRRRPWEPKLLRHPGAGEASVALGAEALGLHVQPTCASRHFEFRIDRFALPAHAELARAAESIDLQVTAIRHADGAPRVLAAETVPVPLASLAESATSAPVVLPARPEAGLRCVSWNVLWTSPQRDPAPFGRVFRALAPDVVLIQEWDQTRYSEHEITSWFAAHVDPEADWQAMVTGTGGYGQGTAVVTRHPILARAPAAVPVEDGRWNFPVRLAAAVVDTPAGRLLTGSVHLKASGALGSDEDRRRLLEADAVNLVLQGMAAVAAPDLVVLGGDFNLNGTSAVLERATRGLDLDRSALAIAQPRQLGDPQLAHTFGRGPLKARFDFLCYSDVNAEQVRSFGLDTTLLPAATLDALGLQRGDAHASDHMPTVLDLRARSVRER